MNKSELILSSNEEGIIKCIAGSCNISPIIPLELAGYEHRTGNFSDIKDNLEANILILESQDKRIIFIQLDLLFVGKEIREELIMNLNQKIEAKELFLSASHTHFAPSTNPSLKRLGMASQDYINFVVKKISSKLLFLLDQEKIDITLHYGYSHCPYVVSRRLPKRWVIHKKFPYIKNTVNMGPDFNKDFDSRLQSISIKNSNEEIIAVIWNWACHPVSFPYMKSISSEFPGRCRKQLRNELNKIDLPIVFLQGFCGDLRPPAVSKKRNYKSIIKSFLRGDSFIHWDELKWDKWSRKVGEKLIYSLSKSKKVKSRILIERKEINLNLILDKVIDSKLSLHLVSLGDDLHVLGISAETVSDYSSIFRKLFKPYKNIILAGYIDNVFGYLPTPKQIKEGGYESHDFKELFSLKESNFIKTYQESITNNLKEMILKLDL